ncbi:hypothetical protein CWI38_1803p0010 [Hamiltosporidium tvaerminnensis]|uniref:Uncharacterized protein n=1 Tax=Hamiltosporidium tvaerminnensis TaxID=1176355 RepID=A0A4V6MVK3_9MICR|nr:hypothetical protein CWI38_1803p0010 [Hamiltosporidium tvaerminnensis]
MARNVAMQALNEKLMKDQIKVLNLWADYFEGYLNEKTKKGKRPQLFEIGSYIFPEKRERNGTSGRNFSSNLLCLEDEGCQSIEIRSL